MAIKPILALQHAKINPPGLVGEILEEQGIAYQVVQVAEERIPDPTNYSAIIAFGGTQHVYDEKQYAFSAREESIIREAIEHDIPYLGVCYGSQLLAHVLGGQVTRMKVADVGFLRVHFTEEGKADPLYAGFTDTLQGYQWHDDTFDVPPEGIQLARNEQGEHQAFRFGRRAYGIQSHIEITPEMMDSWLASFSEEKDKLGGQGDEIYREILRERPTLYPLYRADSKRLLENFLRIAELA